MTRMAWCPGSGRPLGHNAQTYRLPGEKVVCPECGLDMNPKGERLPDHRMRRCNMPGCQNPRVERGLCARCLREIAA